MGIIGKLLNKEGSKIIDRAGKVIDNITSTDDEKNQAKTDLSSIVLESLSSLQDAQHKVALAEVKGNALQRNWRPVVMVSFAFIVFYTYFLQPAFFPNAIKVSETLPEKFWDLLELGLGGYVIGRSMEKVAHNLTKNADISFLKKKDRKDEYL